MARRQLVPYPVSPSRATLVALVSSMAVLLGSAQGLAADPVPPPASSAAESIGPQKAPEGIGGGTAAYNPWLTGSAETHDHSNAPSRLAAPTRLRVEPTGPTTARLTWQPPEEAERVAGYQVFQQGTSTPIAEVPADTLTVTVDTLEPGISYTFAVHTVDRRGAVLSTPAEAELVMPTRTDAASTGDGAHPAF